jgi:hypothetical protein
LSGRGAVLTESAAGDVGVAEVGDRALSLFLIADLPEPAVSFGAAGFLYVGFTALAAQP